MPANEFFDSSGYPSTGGSGSSASMRAELDAIEAGFNKMPTMAAHGGWAVFVNSGATALEAVDLSVSTSSARLGFLQAGTGATARTAQAKMRERYSPEDTGAVGTGSPTDDQPEIAQAITNLATGGGLLEFDSKTYYANAALSSPASVNLKGKGPAHHAFYQTGSVAGTVLLIKGSAAGDCLTLGGAAGGRGNFGIEDMSVYSSGSAAIQSIVRCAGVLHPALKNVEIGGKDVTDGVGLLLNRDASGNATIYGDFTHLKIINVDTGLKISNAMNANTFHGGSIQGHVRAFLIEAPVTIPLSNRFLGTQFEATYSTAMEHEYLAPGTQIAGYTENTAGLYVVKLGKLTGAGSTTFDGCYFEIGSTPATYNDGSHGVLTLVPVVEVGTGVTNTLFDNCEWACYLLDRGTRTRADGLLAGPDYWTKSPPISVRRSSIAGVVPATTWTVVDFATALTEDGTFSWNAVTKVLSVLRAGLYDMSTMVAIDGWAAAQDWCQCRITCGGTVWQGLNMPPYKAGDTYHTFARAVQRLAAGDTIKVEVFTGEATTILGDAAYNHLIVKQC